MKIRAINDYLAENCPVLHLQPDYTDGAYLHYSPDSKSAVLSLKEDKFTDEEMEILMKYPIEIGAYEKNHHLLLLAKIGPSDNPFVYTIKLDPVQPYNKTLIDRIVESRFIVICMIDGKETLTFRGIRLLGIPNEVRDYVVNNWIECIKQGSRYTLKYNNFFQSTLEIDPLELWSRAKKFDDALEE